MRAQFVSTLLSGLLLVLPRPGHCDIDLWPLLETGDDELTVLYPLYVREGKFRMNFPLYYRTNEGQDHHLLWPFVKLSEGRLVRFAPVWFSAEQGTYTFLPFIARNPERTITLLPPMYTRHDGTLRAILPLYAKTPTDLYLLPGYYRLRRPGEAEVDGVYGLFKRSVGPDETKTSALLWSYYFQRDSTSFMREVGYLFWQGENPREKYSALFPLFFRSLEANGQEYLLLLPYFQNRGPTTNSTYLFPIYGRTRSPRVERDIFFPIYMQSRYPGQNSVNTHLLWPVYERRQRSDADGEVTSQYRRFLIFIDKLEPDGTRVFSILGLPVMERTPS